MAEVVVPVKLELLIQDAVKDAKKASDAIGKELEKVGQNTKGSERAAKAIAGFLVADVVVAGIRKLASSLGDFVNEAAEAEKVSVGLANALKLSGDFSQDAVGQFKDLADELANVTKFDDDLILSQVKVAKQFNTSNKEAEKLIRASVELATVLDVDLTTATNLLGKTLDGTAGRLNETIPELKAFSKEALASGAAIDFVLKRFGGTAGSELKTFEGALAQLTKNSKNFQEELGNIIVQNPTVIALIEALAAGFKTLQATIGENSDAIKAFLDAGLKTVVDLFGIFIQTIKVLDEVLTASLVPLNIFARTLQFIFGGLGNLLTLDIKGLAESLNIIGNVSSDNAKQRKAFADRAAAYDSITLSAAKASNFLDDQLSTTTAIVGIESGRTKTANENADAQKRIADALREERKTFEEQIAKFGLSNLKQIEAERDASLKKNRELFENTKSFAENEYKIKKEFDDKLQKQRLDNIRALIANPGEGIGRAIAGKNPLTRDEAIGTGIGTLTNALQGRQGAVTLLSGIAESLGKEFLGIPGLGQLFGLLAQGPEQVKAFVKEFVESVPVIIQAVIESIPAVIDGLIAGMPRFIEALIKSLPRISVALARATAFAIPEAIAKALEGGFNQFFIEIGKGAGRFVDELLRGAGQFIEKIVQEIGHGIEKLFNGLNPFGGSTSGAGGLVGGIGNVVGGIVGAIGGIFGKSDFASDGGGFQRTGPVPSASGDGPVQVNVKIGQRQLAQAMFDLNRQGFRTA